MLAQLSSVGLLLTSAWLIVRAAEHPPVLYLMVAIVAVRFFGLGRAVFRYAERLLTHDAALLRTIDDRVRAYEELDRVAPLGLPRQRRGDVLSRVVRDIDTAQDGLLRIRLPWIYAIVSSSCVVVLLVILSPLAGLILATHVAVCMSFMRMAVSRTSAARRRAAATQQGTMSADTSLLVVASRDLVAYGAARSVGVAMRRSFEDLAGAQRTNTWIGGLGSTLVLASTGVSIAILGLTASGTPAVLMGVILLAPVALLEPLESLAEAERLRPDVVAARGRLVELAEVPTPVTEPDISHPLPVSNSLVVEDVSIGWDKAIATHISFTLDRGELIGICGPSGVGKSTLAMTLSKLVDPLSGSIQIGGTNLADLAGRDVRRRVGLSNQDDTLFDTTIAENLRVAQPTASATEMMAALDRAGLGDFVRGLPLGLATVIGEQGCRLSGGERQRLGLARLVLSDHDILIFDEPTEHLDQPIADALLRHLRELARHHSVLLISHSPRVLQSCDRVIRLAAADATSPFMPFSSQQSVGSSLE